MGLNEVENEAKMIEIEGYQDETESPELVQNTTEVETDGHNVVARIDNIRDEVGIKITDSPDLEKNITEAEAKTDRQNEVATIDNMRDESGIKITDSPDLEKNITEAEAKTDGQNE